MEIYKRGDSGNGVRQIQRALSGAGYGVIVDGYYGPITEEAVKALQQSVGLTADGIVGPATLAKLIPVRFKKSRRTITEIIIHCSATASGMDYTADDIRNWHKKQGWSDIGYHYVIGRHGELWLGRSVDIIGAHCSGHNAHSIGVCYVGGVSFLSGKNCDTRTLAQKAELIKLLRNLKEFYPSAIIVGHHDYDKKKDCPCFDAKTEYSDI